MRVALCINSLGAGGTERSTAVLLPYLVERGLEPVVVTLAPAAADEGDDEAVVAAGVELHRLRPGSRPAQIRQLRALLHARRPAVLHTALFDADLVGRLAAAGTGIPVLASLISTPYDPRRLAVDPNLVAWKLATVRAVDRWTGAAAVAHWHAVTEGVAAHATEHLHVAARRITVVERGRDPEALGRRTAERRARVRDALGLAAADRLVVAVGRQEWSKGHVDLVAAAGRLAASHPDVVTVVAGRRGNASAALDRAVAAAGLGDRFRLLGHRDDVADLVAAADVFVLPSQWEGTAGAVLEAFALEAPVVATRLAGMAGVLRPGENALVVEPGDPAALAGALAEALDDPDAATTRAAAGRRLFLERFTLDRSADGMAALYRRVAAGPARPPALAGRRHRSAGVDAARRGPSEDPGTGTGAPATSATGSGTTDAAAPVGTEGPR